MSAPLQFDLPLGKGHALEVEAAMPYLRECAQRLAMAKTLVCVGDLRTALEARRLITGHESGRTLSWMVKAMQRAVSEGWLEPCGYVKHPHPRAQRRRVVAYRYIPGVKPCE